MSWEAVTVGVGRPKGMSDVEFFSERLGASEGGNRSILASSGTRESFFAAVEILSDEDFLPRGTVFASVIRKQYHRTPEGSVEFHWNDAWEGIPALPVGAAAEVLDALTETDNEQALAWRAVSHKWALCSPALYL